MSVKKIFKKLKKSLMRLTTLKSNEKMNIIFKKPLKQKPLETTFKNNY